MTKRDVRVYKSESAAEIAKRHLEKHGFRVSEMSGFFWILRTTKPKSKKQ